MPDPLLEAIVIGGGQSGLAASYFLQQHGLPHIVFERGRVGESWRSQRWDSFRLNTANKLNTLPGAAYEGNDPDGFATAAEFAASLDAYRYRFQLPVVENTPVMAVEKEEALFKVTTAQGIYRSKNVIIASGDQSAYSRPGVHHSIHAAEYRNAAQLPPGAVLVVGSAQSGVQIAEDLLDNGRAVYLATSMVPRLPGRYRGRDVMDWLIAMKFFEATKEEMPMKAPLLTGIGPGRRTISLQSLAAKGAVLLGTLEADQETLQFLPNVKQHLQFGDAFSQRAKNMIDEFIQATDTLAPEPEYDINDQPAIYNKPVSSLSIDEIGCIIWATGFSADYSYVKLPILDEEGKPIHNNGISAIEGLYFLGLHWLRNRKSGLIMGAKEDAAFIVSSLIAR